MLTQGIEAIESGGVGEPPVKKEEEESKGDKEKRR